MVEHDFFVLASKSNDTVLNEKNDAQAEKTIVAERNEQINNDGDSESTKQRPQKYNNEIRAAYYLSIKDVSTSTSPREAYSDIYNDLKNMIEAYLTETNQIDIIGQLQKEIESISTHCYQHLQGNALEKILLVDLYSNNTSFVPHNLISLSDLCLLKRCYHDDSKRPVIENYFTFVSQLNLSSKLERLERLMNMAGEYSHNEKKYHEQLIKTVSKLVARVIKEAANIAGKHVVIMYEKKKGLRLYVVSSSFFTNALYTSALNNTKTTFTAIHRSDYRMPIYLPIAIDGLIHRKDLRDRSGSLAHEYLRYSFIFLDTLGEFIQGSASSSISVNNRSLENM